MADSRLEQVVEAYSNALHEFQAARDSVNLRRQALLDAEDALAGEKARATKANETLADAKAALDEWLIERERATRDLGFD